MGKLRFLVAVIAAKAAQFVLRIIGRGSNTPGIIALKICPDALARFVMPKTVICVTGTNGKTSTSNLITTALRRWGKSVINNSEGSNMAPGLVSALVRECSLSGKTKADIAVFEVDERSSQYIYPHFTPDFIVCTNLFRDSIMRNGHSEFIFDKINDYLPEKTTLVLNGDDVISGMLGEGKNNRVFFSVEGTDRSSDVCVNTVCDAIACPVCLHRLSFDFYHYHHIGRAHCSECGFALPDAKYKAVSVDFESGSFTFSDGIGEITLPIPADSLFNVYNFSAAAAVCREVGVALEELPALLTDVSSKTGRFGSFSVGNRSVFSLLFKDQNPISGSQSLAYVGRISGEKDVVLMITDPKITRGCEDISWLFDVDFDSLRSPDVKNIFIGGLRGYDVALRLSLVGVDENKIHLYPDYDELISAVCEKALQSGSLAIFFSLYSMPIANRLKAALSDSAKEGALNE